MAWYYPLRIRIQNSEVCSMKPIRGDIRDNGMYYDGFQWRRKGVNHNMTDDGLIFWAGKYRTLEGYLQQGGSLDKIKYSTPHVSTINTVVTNLYNQQKSGYVYAIENKAWKGWVKIGMAVDAEDRLKGYQTSSPHRDYELLHKEFFHNRRRAESKAHIQARKIADKYNSEWFKISKDKVVNIINSIDNTDKDGLQELKEVFNKKDKYGYYK